LYSPLEAARGSNQRGGRMLSVVDLVEAGTFSPRQAAWLLDRILQGSSWLVGARPGGAGKTTVMSALLAMAPSGARVCLTAGDGAWQSCPPGGYLVSYELSPGFYQAYIWGRAVAHMTELGMAGCRLVSNLHADTLEEARAQIVSQCGATEKGFRAFQLFIPLVLKGPSHTPTVEWIDYVRDGLWRRLGRREIERPQGDISGSSPQVGRIAGFLRSCLERNIRLLEEVRKSWLEWCDRFHYDQ
jgi:hypothetical protein